MSASAGDRAESAAVICRLLGALRKIDQVRRAAAVRSAKPRTGTARRAGPESLPPRRIPAARDRRLARWSPAWRAAASSRRANAAVCPRARGGPAVRPAPRAQGAAGIGIPAGGKAECPQSSHSNVRLVVKLCQQEVCAFGRVPAAGPWLCSQAGPLFVSNARVLRLSKPRRLRELSISSTALPSVAQLFDAVHSG